MLQSFLSGCYIDCFKYFQGILENPASEFFETFQIIPDSKVHGTNMGPIWGRQDPGGRHVGPMNLAIWDLEVFIIHMFKSMIELDNWLVFFCVCSNPGTVV